MHITSLLHNLNLINGRHHLATLSIKDSNKDILFKKLDELNIPTLNIGLSLATFIDQTTNLDYIEYDAAEFLNKLINKNRKLLPYNTLPVLLVYNLGILFEPSLKMNPSSLLLKWSKDTTIVILWENPHVSASHLTWKNNNNIGFLFKPEQNTLISL